jgi:hypothetical protein
MVQLVLVVDRIGDLENLGDVHWFIGFEGLKL